MQCNYLKYNYLIFRTPLFFEFYANVQKNIEICNVIA